MSDPSKNDDHNSEPEHGDQPAGSPGTAVEQAPPGGSGGGSDSGPTDPRRALTLAVVALVLALFVTAGGLGGAWWLWQRVAALEAEQEDFVRQEAVSELRDDMSRRGERLLGRVDNLAEEHSNHVDTLAEVRERMETIAEEYEVNRERMDRIEELAAAHRDEWIRAEAGYLYGVARYRTRFHADVDGALQALREADALLEELGGQTVDERQAVREGINALLDVDLPDRAAMAADLADLISAVDEWPLAHAEREVETIEMSGQPDAELDSLDGWQEAGQRAWSRFRETLGSLVVVRRGERPPRLMAPEESRYLRQNLRLELLTARTALLDGERAVYRDSLAVVDDWLGDHFDGEAEAVVNARETIATLRDARLEAELPDLGAILPERELPGRYQEDEE